MFILFSENYLHSPTIEFSPTPFLNSSMIKLFLVLNSNFLLHKKLIASRHSFLLHLKLANNKILMRNFFFNVKKIYLNKLKQLTTKLIDIAGHVTYLPVQIIRLVLTSVQWGKKGKIPYNGPLSLECSIIFAMSRINLRAEQGKPCFLSFLLLYFSTFSETRGFLTTRATSCGKTFLGGSSRALN